MSIVKAKSATFLGRHVDCLSSVHARHCVNSARAITSAFTDLAVTFSNVLVVDFDIEVHSPFIDAYAGGGDEEVDACYRGREDAGLGVVSSAKIEDDVIIDNDPLGTSRCVLFDHPGMEGDCCFDRLCEKDIFV